MSHNKVMNQSYSTLSATDRCLVAVPSHPWTVNVTRHGEDLAVDNVLEAEVTNFHGATKMYATKVGNDCYDVVFTKFARIYGKLRETATVEFTTTRSWIDQWIEMAHASYCV